MIQKHLFLVLANRTLIMPSLKEKLFLKLILYLINTKHGKELSNTHATNTYSLIILGKTKKLKFN